MYKLLLVTGGEDWYQEEGKPAQFLIEHIAITEGTPEWLEPVDE